MANDSSNLFDKLAIETNQHIASFLEYDEEICHFRLVCRSTHDAIEADNCSFWRRRFLSWYEDPGWAYGNNDKYKRSYQRRRSVLKNGAIFKSGETSKEKGCLEVLRDLVVESFSAVPTSSNWAYESANLQHIQRFLIANDLLQIIFKPSKQATMRPYIGSRRRKGDHDNNPTTPSPILQTIQVLCAPMLLSFEPHLAIDHYGFPDSQMAVYSTPSVWPIFIGVNGLDVNMPFILHNINFWRYHMVREVEGTLFYPFVALQEYERPRWWNSRLKQGERKLGKHWKGSYAFVQRDEMDAMRVGRGETEQIQDLFAGEDHACSFQDMQLELIPDGETVPWPNAFEQHLRSLTPPPSRAKTRAQKRCATPDEIADFKPLSFRFDGEGKDVSEAFLASGWLNPLPPQQGVPGWQRVTMMKYFEEDDDSGVIDESALWAYEGVVLPGGQIMMGRWWCPGDEQDCSGPWILWCVDGPEHDAAEG